MNLLKIVFFVCVAFVGFTIYARYGDHSKSGAEAESPVPTSAAGFVALPAIDLPSGKAVIATLPDFTKEETKRVRDLDFQLMQAGIPREIRSGLAFEFETKADARLFSQFATSTARPIVFVRGKAKGNPTVMDVVAEFRGVPLPTPSPEAKK